MLWLSEVLRSGLDQGAFVFCVRCATSQEANLTLETDRMNDK